MKLNANFLLNASLHIHTITPSCCYCYVGGLYTSFYGWYDFKFVFFARCAQCTVLLGPCPSTLLIALSVIIIKKLNVNLFNHTGSMSHRIMLLVILMNSGAHTYTHTHTHNTQHTQTHTTHTNTHTQHTHTHKHTDVWGQKQFQETSLVYKIMYIYILYIAQNYCSQMSSQITRISIYVRIYAALMHNTWWYCISTHQF